MKNIKILFYLFLFILFTSTPIVQACNVGDVVIKQENAFIMSFTACNGSDAEAWPLSISFLNDDCNLIKTNLISYWDGCSYKLFQVNNIDDKNSELIFVGRFKNLNIMKEFIKDARPIFTQEKQ